MSCFSFGALLSKDFQEHGQRIDLSSKSPKVSCVIILLCYDMNLAVMRSVPVTLYRGAF